MELKEFVTETMTQIALGVAESIEAVRDAGGYVNPATRTNAKQTDNGHFANMANGQSVFLVDFNVALTVEEQAGSDAKARVQVAGVLELGAGGESGNRSASTSSVSFKIPMALPVDPVSAEELQERERQQKAQMNEQIRKLNERTSRSRY